MKRTIYTGGYTDTSKGIYICEFDTDDEEICVKAVEENCENPNFIVVHKEKKLLCALNEDAQHAWLTSYIITDDGKLMLADCKKFEGKAPCHISMDKRGKRVFFANYETSEIGMVMIERNGKFLGDIKRIIHKGKSVSERQMSAHPHGVHVLDGERLAVPDLGTDEIRIYDISESDMILADIIKVTPGDGPRHVVLHPNRNMLYVICELKNVIHTFIYEEGRWAKQQRISILPPNAQGEFIAGEIAITADGSYLLASTRAWGNKRNEEGCISIFRINDKGLLCYEKSLQSGGSHPRMFTITDDDRYVLVANQYSGNLIGYKFDSLNGDIKKICSVDIPEITCVLCN